MTTPHSGTLNPTTNQSTATPISPSSRSSSRTPNVRRQETEDSEKAGRVWAREAESDPWAPCILTLDGGGIRGFSSLLILERLMHEVCVWEQRFEDEEYGGGEEEGPRGREGREENILNGKEGVREKRVFVESDLLPCHYFDFMYGTSTGGLIATILGRLRMSVREGLHLYRQVGDDLFGSRRSRIPLMTKYHHEPLERAVRKIVAAKCHAHPNCDGNDLHPWDLASHPPNLPPPSPTIPPQIFDVHAPRVCQSCSLTATHDENISEAYLLRSYPHYYSEKAPNWITRYNEGADAIPIWALARATTAAPFYFEMLRTTIAGVERDFKDGGIRENNPSGAALSEFHALYEGSGIEQPAVMLSVGTGRPDTSLDGFASAWPGPFSRIPFVSKFLEKRAVLQNLLIKYTEGEKQHEMMRNYARGEHTWYKRLNVSAGLERMALDDWVKGDFQGEKGVEGGASLERMRVATEEYLRRGFDEVVDSYAPPGIMLEQVAEKIVRQRRARERVGGRRWEVFVGNGLEDGDGVGRVEGDEG